MEGAARTARSASFSCEQRHQSIAQLLGDLAAYLGNRRRSGVKVSTNQIAPFLGVESSSDVSRRVLRVNAQSAGR